MIHLCDGRTDGRAIRAIALYAVARKNDGAPILSQRKEFDTDIYANIAKIFHFC